MTQPRPAPRKQGEVSWQVSTCLTSWGKLLLKASTLVVASRVADLARPRPGSCDFSRRSTEGAAIPTKPSTAPTASVRHCTFVSLAHASSYKHCCPVLVLHI